MFLKQTRKRVHQGDCAEGSGLQDHLTRQGGMPLGRLLETPAFLDHCLPGHDC